MSDNQEILNISELYGNDDKDLPDRAYPIRYHDITKAQKTDAKLQQNIVSHKDYTLDTFCGENQNHRLIFRNNKICLPTALQKKNGRLVSQDALSSRRESNIAHPQSTF